MNTDYIIVGAGPAGATIASRLTENPNISVTLLEAGDENNNELGRTQGAFYYLSQTDANWGYHTTPQAGLMNRVLSVTRGKVVGGCSALNVGYWARGAAGDFDNWNALGLPSWNAQTALDAYKKIEHTDRPLPLRGNDGPVWMETLPRVTPLADALAAAFTEAGYGPAGDTNDVSPYVVNHMESIFRNHYRLTIADAYLPADVRRRPNLTIITKAQATKINFDQKKAISIDYISNGKTVTLAPNKEIILASGSINTPQLLMLSGIGPAEHLKSVNINVVQNLAGVGSNLQDHLATSVSGLSAAGVKGSVLGSPNAADIEEWRLHRTGQATRWSSNSAGFVRIEPTATRPDFELLLSYNPTGDEGTFTNLQGDANRSGYVISVVNLHPESRGTVRLQSNDPMTAPIIDPAYLSNSKDIEKFATGLRMAHKLTSTKALAPYTEQVSPAANATDGELEQYIREKAGTIYHPVGTARMGTQNDPNAVVDNFLKVIGIEGLRVADSSVFPTIISGHTMAPSIYVGEQMAKFILAGN